MLLDYGFSRRIILGCTGSGRAQRQSSVVTMLNLHYNRKLQNNNQEGLFVVELEMITILYSTELMFKSTHAWAPEASRCPTAS